MPIDLDEIRSHFSLLSDESLLATNRDDLVDAAKAIYDEELASRGLNEEEPADDAPVAADAEPQPEGEVAEALVAVGSFTIVDDARMANGLLRSAEIPCGLVNDKENLGVLHLMVPASFEQEALEVLAGEISEEELAAQAEAAEAETYPS